MSNFFAEDTPAVAGNNAFAETLASTPIDAGEQDVIRRTNNPTAETPTSFGLVDVPLEPIKGVLSAAASLPRIAAGTLVEAGEQIPQTQGQSMADVAKASMIKRIADNIVADQQGGAANVVNRALPFRTFRMMAGAEKDALLSLLSGTQAPKVMVNAGNAMIAQNTAAFDALGLNPKGGGNFGYNVGGALGQVGAMFLLKTPEAAQTYFTAMINSDTYMEARKAGKEPEAAARIAAESAYGQGMLFALGGSVFRSSAAGSGAIKSFLAKTLGLGAMGAGVAAVDTGVKNVEGVRHDTPEQIAMNIGYQALVMFVAGLPVAAVHTKIEQMGKDANLPQDRIDEIAGVLVQNKDAMVDAGTALIDKEGAGVTNDAPARAETIKTVKQVFADHAAVEEAQATGSTDNPEIAAKILAGDPNTSPETKAAIEALPKGFSMDELQAAAGKDMALANALALEEKHTQTLQEHLDRWKEMTSSVRENTALTKRQIKETQTMLTDFINKSELEAADKAKFLNGIKNTQTSTQLVKSIDDVESRINELLDAQQRREALSGIKNTVEKAQQSTVAVDFSKQVEQLASEIDTKKRTPETLSALQKTLDFMQKNPAVQMPKDVLKKLEILNKKPLEQVTTKELQALHEQLKGLVKQGKTKLSLMENQKERLKQTRITELQKESVPLSTVDPIRAPIGERLSVMDKVKNKYIETKNRLGKIGLATNPMDVFFDMLDGGKSYKGANHRIFKQTVDKSFSRYLDLKDTTAREVKALSDKLDLNVQNYEKIGAWAVLQQEGGEKKLLNSGITKEEIASLTLTKPEMQMYQLMRQKLDGMLPAIQEVMRTVYNKNVDGVKDYFPFMTDHEAMKDLEIQDQLGDQVPQFGDKKNVERGFTESRTLGKQKIRIDALGVFLKHIDNAAYLTELGGDIKSLGDVAGAPEYKKAVGDIGQEMVGEWINLLARKGNIPGRIPMIDALRRNVGFAVLGFKLSSFLAQPTSLADGAALVGGTHVAEGVFKVADRQWRQFLVDNMPELRDRIGDDQAYLDMGGNGVISDVRQAGFWALKKLDSLAASAVAIGAYTKSVEDRGGTVDLSKPDPVAIQEAQFMMRRTQSSAFAKDTPAILTQGELSGNVSVDKLILQFQSFMLNRWSLIKHDMWQEGIKKGNIKQSVNIATWLLLATAAEVGIRRLSKDLVNALTGGETKPWQDTITKEAVTTALGNVPFISQAVGALEYGSLPVPALAVANQIASEMKLAAQSKDPSKKARHLEKAALIGAGVAFGVPGTSQAVGALGNTKGNARASVSTP